MENLIKFILIFLLFLLSYAEFTSLSISLAGVQSGFIAQGDYNNDGKIDIAITGTGEGNTPFTKIFKNTGTSFIDSGITLIQVKNSSLCWLDYNNDGLLDIAIAGEDATGTKQFKIYQNKGNDVFEEKFTLEGFSNCSIAPIDYNNDGLVDLVIAGESASGIKTVIFKNEGKTLFSSAITLDNNSAKYGCVRACDIDNDGYSDIILSGYDNSNSPILKIFKNNDGSLSEVSGLNLPGFAYSSISFADYDNDGKVDFAIGGGPGVYIYKNTSNGGSISFSIPITLALGIPQASLLFKDFNNDGAPDLLVSGGNDTISATFKIYYNTLNTFFEYNFEDVDDTLKFFNSSIEAFDIYNDGKIDIVVTGTTDGTDYVTKVYINNVDKINIKPNPPQTNFSFSVSGIYSTLSWGVGSDAESSNISYRIRIGTTPNGNEILSGIIGSPFTPIFSNRIILKNLPLDKIIYWSVKTIDAAGVESDWSDERASYGGGPLSYKKECEGYATNKMYGNNIVIYSPKVVEQSGIPISGVPIKFIIRKPNGDTIVYKSFTDSTGITKITLSSSEVNQIGIYEVTFEGYGIELPTQKTSFVVTTTDEEISVGPNPFTPTKFPYNKVGFTIRAEEEVSLKIFDISGVLIKSQSFTPGENVEWDGKDDKGNIVEGGIYIWQIKVGSKIYNGSIVVVR
jgi:hypothetical protein